MAKPPSLPEQAAAYYAAKDKNYMPLLRAAAEKIPERDEADLIAAEEENWARAVDANWRPKHKDNIYPDPAWPRKENLPPFKETNIKLDDLPEKVDFGAIREMIKEMREASEKEKDEESKEAWATIDRISRREPASSMGGGGSNKAKGKGKEKK